ncbi:phospholipase A and acyltransferase 3-like [Haliotis rubra]|uniref:phospholipase A and acyltransferase 3-like n=1 Tax=Haliotis rubra TaxID=36100 RepID=UPI001EE5AAA7|nr:phospholipase A and acyltransferase 3-like [Haliotis rubra]
MPDHQRITVSSSGSQSAFECSLIVKKLSSHELQTHNWTVLDHLEPGDLLEFDRGVYSHWAVYVGNDEVVHLSGVDGAGRRDLKHPCTISGVKSDKGIVRKDDFWTVTEDSKAEINNFKDLKFKPLEPSKIVQRALSKVREVGYNLLYMNCEHFATWCWKVGLFAAVASYVGGAVVAGAGIALAVLFGSGRKEEREKRSKN